MDKINRERLLCWILEVRHQGGGTSDPAKLEAECGYKPHWSLHDGIAEFMKWYKSDKNPLR